MTKVQLKDCLDRLLQKSQALAQKGEIPVAAMLILEDGSAFLDGNAVEEKDDPFQHAEIRVLRQAMAKTHGRYLKGAVLLVSLEPCLLCMGAILKAGIKDLYYVLDDEELGALSHYHAFVDDVLRIHRIQDDRFLPIMKAFFSSIRNKEKKPSL